MELSQYVSENKLLNPAAEQVFIYRITVVGPKCYNV